MILPSIKCSNELPSGLDFTLKPDCRINLCPLFWSLHSGAHTFSSRLIQSSPKWSSCYLSFFHSCNHPAGLIVLKNNKYNFVMILLLSICWLSLSYRIKSKFNKKGHSRPFPIWPQPTSLASISDMPHYTLKWISLYLPNWPCPSCFLCVMPSAWNVWPSPTLPLPQPGKLLFFSLENNNNNRSNGTWLESFPWVSPGLTHRTFD